MLQEDSLATSSQDSTVQFWNLASPQKSENMIKIPGSPVWKLQHTPVGSGLLALGNHFEPREAGFMSLKQY